MDRSYTAAELADIVEGTLRGRGEITVCGIEDIRYAKSEHVSWISSPKFQKYAESTGAGVILAPESMEIKAPCVIFCPNIQRSIAKLLQAFAPPPSALKPGIHESAVVDSSAKIGQAVIVGPHVSIEAGASVGDRTTLEAGVRLGRDVTVGSDCNLQHNVVICHHCTIGNRVTILPNAVVGGDGFGFHFNEGAHQRVPHIGGVIVNDDVEIGACTCIDRAKFGDTVIGAGTKIDNLVQLAHNVQVGANSLIVAQTGIAGSVRIGKGCVFAGRSGAVDNIEIGDGAQIAASSVPWSDVPAGATVVGNPAQDKGKSHRVQIQMRRLPELAAKVKELLTRVEQLESAADHQQ